MMDDNDISTTGTSLPPNATRWRRFRRHLMDILREKDQPARIARGAGIGIFVALLPIMGIQMPVATMLALPLRGNIKAAIAGVWLTNPLTFIPLYYAVYRFGLLLAPSRRMEWGVFETVFLKSANWNWAEIRESLIQLLNMSADIMVPLWLGGAVWGLIFGVATYFATLRAVKRLRARRAARSKRRRRPA
jgi:uncharacterized protein (DUF2062 family)